MVCTMRINKWLLLWQFLNKKLFKVSILTYKKSVIYQSLNFCLITFFFVVINSTKCPYCLLKTISPILLFLHAFNNNVLLLTFLFLFLLSELIVKPYLIQVSGAMNIFLFAFMLFQSRVYLKAILDFVE